jgi:hypothetical protein
MQVKIQRKGHAVEVLTSPTFEQCFNAAGGMQCTFLEISGAIALPVTAPPIEVARIVHLTDTDNKAKVEHGFADVAWLFGQNVPHVLTRGDGGQATLFKNHTTAGVYVDGTVPRFFNIRPNAAGTVPHAQFVCDGH